MFLTTSAQTNLSLRVAKRGESALNGAVMQNISLYMLTNVDVTLLTHSGCVSAATPPSLWSTWNLMACGSTLTWPSITLCKHVSRSRVARFELASFSLGVWIAPTSAHRFNPWQTETGMRSLDVSVLLFSFLEVFWGEVFTYKTVTQAPACTLVAIGEDWNRQELTGQGRIMPNGWSCSPMSDPDCDPQPSDHFTGGWKLLHCTPANVNL